MLIATDQTPSNDAPQYGSKPTKPGLYLGLFHGRHSPQAQMNGWGFDGPTIGPLKWVHTTYAFDIKLEFVNAADAVDYFGIAQEQFELQTNGDMLVYGNAFYGDWTAYYVAPEDCERPADTFRATTRENTHLAHRKFLV